MTNSKNLTYFMTNLHWSVGLWFSVPNDDCFFFAGSISILYQFSAPIRWCFQGASMVYIEFKWMNLWFGLRLRIRLLATFLNLISNNVQLKLLFRQKGQFGTLYFSISIYN
jgi:hypothetical protein